MVSFLHLLFFEHLNATQCFYTWYFIMRLCLLLTLNVNVLCFIHSFTSVPRFLSLCVSEWAQCETAELMADSITPMRDRQVLTCSFLLLHETLQSMKWKRPTHCLSVSNTSLLLFSKWQVPLSVCLSVWESVCAYLSLSYFSFSTLSKESS